ncbi:bacterio-opsin activator domain-containing protein [Halomarina litorea]|uniref:helix-turn-helix domain-containing protein n=1 Tax=Halomarina litorea TaxID=2961595 RepID=UPI0020C3E4FB|nr:bacterio-opsin activator domain-containing protein [Halomarina sp. BCD28]
MGTMAEVCIPADEFALHQTFLDAPDAHLDVQRVVAHGPDRVMPFLWATADDFDALDQALDADPSVEDVTHVSEFEDERLYRMAWVDRIELVSHALLEEDATVFEAAGSHDEWHLRLFFPEREGLSRTHDIAEEGGLTLHVEKVYELNEERRDRYGLTDPQHETLVAAFENDYYDFPHGVTTEDLGERFDISAQAVADRLRRGHGNLVEETLIVGRGADFDE